MHVICFSGKLKDIDNKNKAFTGYISSHFHTMLQLNRGTKNRMYTNNRQLT